jgi:penicillin-binding protein 1C
MDADLVLQEGQPAPKPRPQIPRGVVRQIGLYLSDPVARLPCFQRYGATEFPFAVALKTGTSQGYRDAWIIAWSERNVVGVWVGRADAGAL